MSKPIPLTTRLSKTSSFADLAAHVAHDPALEGRKAKDIAWAFRTLAKACGAPMELILIDPKALNERLDAFAPATIGIGDGTWVNAKNLIRFALRHFGFIKPAAQRVMLAPCWTEAMRRLSDQGQLIGIGRLARYCTDQNITPEQVDDLIFDAFLVELETQQIKGGGRRTHRRIAQIWNQLANTMRGWPNQLVKIPNYSRRYALDWPAFPVSLQHDIDKHLAELDGTSARLFARAGTLKASSIKSRRHQLHILISGMVLSGVDIASLRSLADVVKPDTVETGLQYLVDRVGEERLTQVFAVLQTVLTIARNYVMAPQDEIKPLADLCRKLKKAQTEGMSDKNRMRLRQFDDEANVSKLLNLPDMLIIKAKRTDDNPADNARLVQTACIIELLITIPIRRHNLATLLMSKHFQRKPDGSMYLFISGKEVKNGVDIDAKLPPQLVRLLDLYKKVYRPLLAQEPSDWLFPGVGNRPKSRERLAYQLSHTLEREAGLQVHMHLFRHIGAKLYLEDNPGSYGVVQRLLGHRSIETTIGIYCGTETRAAVAHYGRSVLARKTGRAVT